MSDNLHSETVYNDKEIFRCDETDCIYTEDGLKRIEELEQRNKELADNLEEAEDLHAEWMNEVAPKISELKKHNKELEQALKEASGMINALISYAKYEKQTQEMCKNHAESRDIQDLIELANDTVKQAERMLEYIEEREK